MESKFSITRNFQQESHVWGRTNPEGMSKRKALQESRLLAYDCGINIFAPPKFVTKKNCMPKKSRQEMQHNHKEKLRNKQHDVVIFRKAFIFHKP